MAAMPRLTEPPGMPQEVVTAIETIGNRARTEILRLLTTQGPLTAAELAEHLGATKPSVHGHLAALEASGLVAGDVEFSQRPGRTVRWKANRRRIQQLATTWARYATGE
jgi:predicted ArsR family transcriptional regulator